jgi:hypothetical protein
MTPLHIAKAAPIGFALLVTLGFSVGGASAQDTDPPQARQVIIEQREPHTKLRGTLLHLNSDRLIALIGTDRQEVPMDNVLTIKTRGDSLTNGAVAGAIVGGLVSFLFVHGELDSPSQVAAAVAINAGFYAAIGAGIDALMPGYTTIYRRPQGADPATAGPTRRERSARRAALSVRWRF